MRFGIALRDSGELQAKVVLDLIGLTMATPLGTAHLLQDHFRALLPCQLQVPSDESAIPILPDRRRHQWRCILPVDGVVEVPRWFHTKFFTRFMAKSFLDGCPS